MEQASDFSSTTSASKPTPGGTARFCFLPGESGGSVWWLFGVSAAISLNLFCHPDFWTRLLHCQNAQARAQARCLDVVPKSGKEEPEQFVTGPRARLGQTHGQRRIQVEPARAGHHGVPPQQTILAEVACIERVGNIDMNVILGLWGRNFGTIFRVLRILQESIGSWLNKCTKSMLPTRGDANV